VIKLLMGEGMVANSRSNNKIVAFFLCTLFFFIGILFGHAALADTTCQLCGYAYSKYKGTSTFCREEIQQDDGTEVTIDVPFRLALWQCDVDLDE